MTEILPEIFVKLRQAYPEVAAAYDALGDAAHRAGPLADRERQLVKLALAIGAGLEGATHAHTRRAVALGISAEEIRQVTLLSITTLGFPAATRAYTWVNDILNEG
jgi:alkylhydroperoxidase/carboxymuconolactone decarboxylase family protein YurZ